MTPRRPVTGAYDAYRAHSRGPTPSSGSTRRPAPRSPTPASARRRAPGRARRAVVADGRPTSPQVMRRRLIALPTLSVLLFAVVVGKLADIQVRNPDRFLQTGQAQRTAAVTLPAGRGALLDRNGEALALSVPRRTAFADPSILADPAEAARRLAPVLTVDRLQLERRLSGSGRFVVLGRMLSDDVADRVEALGIDGIGMVEEQKRFRPSDDLARSILGTVTADGSEGADGRVGISGLESQLDHLLTGTPGEVTYERAMIGGGDAIAGSRRRPTPARPGAEVTLTLDRALQYETERTLTDHLARSGAEGGIAIVSRPSTGEILALANIESVDGGGYRSSANNLALTTVYEPGSVNKVITVAAAIEEGLVTPESQRSVPDGLQVGNHRFTDSHPHPTTDWSVADILATSSNVGTIMLAQELGGERLDGYLRRFGFGRPSGLGFPAESAGILLPTEDWELQSTAIGSIPIGQGVSVTALQMLQAFNVLATDGIYVPARLVRGIERSDGRTMAVPSPEPRRVVAAETAAAVRAMMEQVVARGTGQSAAVPGYTVAGKTGTARKPQATGSYVDAEGDMHYVATFAGLLPAEKPDLSVIVVVDEPDPGLSIYAGAVAAPAFSDLARLALRRLAIPPSVGGSVADVPELSESAQAIQETALAGAASPMGTDTANPDTADPGATNPDTADPDEGDPDDGESAGGG